MKTMHSENADRAVESIITERIKRHTPLDWAEAERATANSRCREAQAEQTEQRAERHRHVVRCGFELVGVTMRPRTGIDKFDLFGTQEESEPDRIMSSLVSVLGAGQKVAFIYEGGGRAPLQWHIVGEASSAELAKEADERLRNFRSALITVLEGRKAFFRFREISKDAADQVGAVRGKWIGTIQPQGTHVKCTKAPVGFRAPTDPVQATDTSVCLPHYLHERARAFSSIVKLLVSSPVSLRVSIALLPPATAIRLVGPHQQELVEPGRCVMVRSPRTTRVSLVIPATALTGQEVFYLELVRHRNGQPVQTTAFHSLDVVKVARELRVECLDLFAQQAGQCIYCHRMHNEVEQLGFNLKLTLDNPEHRSFLNQMGAEFQVELVRAADAQRQLGLWHKVVQFRGSSFCWEQPMGEAKALFLKGLGNHRLCLRFADATLASKSFPVVTLKACIAEARNTVKQNASLWDCAVRAVNHRQVTVPLDVVAEDFRQINVSLMLDAPQPEPLLAEVELTLGIIMRRAAIEVGRQSRNITVKPGRHRFEDSVELVPEMFEGGTGLYSIEILLDDRSLKRLEFVHKTRAQLKEAKAEEILRSLVLRDPRLFALRDGKRVETDHLFETDRAIAPAFCIEGRGFDEDASVLQWRLGLKLVNLESGKSIQESQFVLAREGQNIHNDLELPLCTDTRKLAPGHYVLQLRKRREMLTDYKFCILALAEIIPYSKKVILQNLRAEGQMFIQAGQTRYQNPYVPDTSDGIVPELTIHSAGFNSHLPQMQMDLHVFVASSSDRRTEVACMAVNLSPRPSTLHNLAIPVRGTHLASVNGPCRLVFAIADKELLVLPFEMVSEEKVLEQIKVMSVNVEAQMKAGGRRTNPDVLRLSEHETISVAVDIEIGIPAPNATVEFSLALKLDKVVIGHAESDLQLNRTRLVVKGGKLKLKSLVPHPSASPQKLTIVLIIAGEEKGSYAVAVVSASRVSNFEGQLTVDAHQIEVDDAEYERILSRL